jgi:curved DNA-binding protein CbpA
MAGAVLDPFEALGLPRDATPAAIKSRYLTLARKYHPNRHRHPTVDGLGQETEWENNRLSEHFHNVHQAWKLLSKADNRRRRAELLNLLDLQEEMLSHYMDLISEEHANGQQPRQNEGHDRSDHEGYISSDADEDLPAVGVQRRKTFRNTHVAHLGDVADHIGTNSPTSPTKKQIKSLAMFGRGKTDRTHEADYFTLRRKKLEKLRRKELEAFIRYRDCMVIKFEAEEEAEMQYEHYERAKWKREYFERAPRATTERFRSFQHFMGAVAAFGEQTTPKRRKSPNGSGYGIVTPVEHNAQLLFPERGRKTQHRRGWSSDISGDQSDSEEDLGDSNAYRRTPPLSGWNPYPRRSSENYFDAQVRATPLSTGNEYFKPPSGLKIVVRDATDLGSVQDIHDSSGESISGPSRSPSPYSQTNGINRNKAIWIPSTGPSRVFGMSPDRRTRSASPVPFIRRPSGPGSDQNSTPKIPGDGLQFITKQIGSPHLAHIFKEHVYELNAEEKFETLGLESENEVDPQALLDRLQRLSPMVAAKFKKKENILEKFKFRLIYGEERNPSQQHHSFIALSYRRRVHVEEHPRHFTLPLDREIFQAVVEERHAGEGLWIDQICIKQGCREETMVSMSAMDMVYRSARLVVVALDDIILDPQEAKLLQEHMDEYNAMTHVVPRQRFRRKRPPYLETHDNLFKVIRKILRSSWFKRAWCRHEMRLAKHHVFLIPAKSSSRPGLDVLRFNSKCISHLLDLATEVPFEQDVESVKAALHAFFRDRSKMGSGERGMLQHHGNFSTVVAEVFAMEAGGDPRIPAEQREADALRDKTAICLNTMECGLSIADRFRDLNRPLSEQECYQDLMMLSLAAQDPGALSAVGAPLPITDRVHSWVYTPTVADSGLNNAKTLPRLPDDARFVVDLSGPEHYIQLDLKFLKGGRRGCDDNPLEEEELELARRFIDVCDERQWGRNRKRYLTYDRKAKLLFGDMREVYVETLACVLTCGPDYVSDVCQRYSMSRWRVDLRFAYELMVALRNTCGRWPVEAWTERGASFLMDFVNFLIIRGLPLRQILKREQWRPVWVPMPNGGKVIAFEPLGSGLIRPAIPTALINPDYVHLARLWILQPRPLPPCLDENDQTTKIIPNYSEWTLLGKSVLFSDELAIEQMTSFDGYLKEQQKVYGRERKEQPKEVYVRERKPLNGVTVRL